MRAKQLVEASYQYFISKIAVAYDLLSTVSEL